MKYLALISLFLFYAFFQYQEKQTSAVGGLTDSVNVKVSVDDSSKIIAKQPVKVFSSYSIKVSLDVQKKLLKASQTIKWKNPSVIPTSELYFHLYPNAFSNRGTEFLGGRRISDNSLSHISINSVTVNHQTKKLNYSTYKTDNRFDSTVAKIVLDKPATQNDSLEIAFEYEVKIPKAYSRFGYDANEIFFFLAQWFPKLGVYENGKWVCEPFHPFTEFYADFSNYSLEITIPNGFVLASSGEVTGKKVEAKNTTYKVVQKNIHDFAWLAAKDVLDFTDTIKRKDHSEVAVHYILQTTNEGSRERICNAVHNAFSFFEKNIGRYPYKTLTVIDAPTKAGMIRAMEYPALFTFSKDYFSPEFTKDLDEVILHEFSHQYFYGLLANNETTEAWLDEGFAEYVSQKILQKKYGQRFASFKLFGYLPVTGMELLAIERIPFIYTLTQIPKPFEADLMAAYYSYATFGTLSDTSFRLLNKRVYQSVSYAKGALFLFTLEKYLGEQKLLFVLRQYFNQYKFKHPTANDFFTVLRKYSHQDVEWLITGFYEKSYTCDYKILEIDVSHERHQVEVTIVRDGEAAVPLEIDLYTNKDTIKTFWNGKEKIKRITFTTSNKVIAAEIDPERKNLFDLNFANNSYTVNTRYSGAMYISVRWFFWLQNLLMIFGGLS
ncbi:MAG: M1 family metallopeptidase [Ignavibacteria bacterium]|nr:M1 family metallopeptidase [Ignavibacteria bacterium]